MHFTLYLTLSVSLFVCMSVRQPLCVRNEQDGASWLCASDNTMVEYQSQLGEAGGPLVTIKRSRFDCIFSKVVQKGQ